MRLRTLLATAALAFLAAPAALAQTTFTELDPGIPPPPLNGPDDDYWVTAIEPADYDNDGDLDLLALAYYVNYVTEEEVDLLTLYRNDGPGTTSTAWTFTPVDVPLPDSVFATTGDIAWGDYDNDGDLDVVVGFEQATGLYRNDGGTLVLTDVPLPAYLEGQGLLDFGTYDRRSLTWADYDNDGDLDLLIPSVYHEIFDIGYTELVRNDGPGGPAGWTFTVTDPGLPRTYNAQTAWGDTDGDGDLDLLLFESGQADPDSGFVHVYQNDGGALTFRDSLAVRPDFGMADWADYDNDGDLDILVGGLLETPSEVGALVKVYRNDGGTYTEVHVAGEPDWLDIAAVSWADYDSDGDVDVLVSGTDWDAFEGRSAVYANQGGVFVRLPLVLPAPMLAFNGGAFTWLDLEGDGDLDYLVSGAYGDGIGGLLESMTRLFRNDATAPNTAPGAPGSLVATVEGDDVSFAWTPAPDGQTPSDGLTYNLWVRRPGSDIVSPMSRPDGGRMVPAPGNVSHNTGWSLYDLEPGTYTWTVQAVDNAFNGGTFATEVTFTVGTTAAEEGPGAGAVALRGVLPNPAASGITVVFDLPAPAEVSAAVFDALGREVLAAPARVLTAGEGRALALDVRGLPAGAYLVRVEVRRGEAVEYRTARLTVAR